LAHIVDALREGAAAEAEERQPIVDAGIGAILTVVEEAAVEEGQRVDDGDRVRSNDLARVVDALRAPAFEPFEGVRGRGERGRQLKNNSC
jgi:hypothetical protein